MFHSDPTDRQSHNQEPHGPNPGDAVFLRQITKTYRRGGSGSRCFKTSISG